MKILKQLYKYWMKFAHLLGTVNGYIILTLFYVFVIGIYALPKKIFSRKRSGDLTYWDDKKNDSDPFSRAKFQF